MPADESGEPGQYGTPSRTEQGEWVRSKGEKKIADYFTLIGLRYKYEDRVPKRKEPHKRVYALPDFYLPDYNLYVEYWGLTGSSEQYDAHTKEKAAVYHDNGIRFISIFPEDLDELDSAFKSKFRDVMGYPLPQHPEGAAVGARYCTRCGAPARPPGKFCYRCGSTIY